MCPIPNLTYCLNMNVKRATKKGLVCGNVTKSYTSNRELLSFMGNNNINIRFGFWFQGNCWLFIFSFVCFLKIMK